MKRSRSLAHALVALATAALSTGCEVASQRSASAPGSITNAASLGVGALTARPRFDAFVGAQPRAATRPDRRTSWVSSDVKNERRLMFASDSGLEEVDLYSLPSMKLKGQLTGFNYPQGLCSDTHGNVYVTDTNNTVVDEYSHAGVLLAGYPDNYGLPVGCAVDPATGNLAVTDIVNDGSGPGEVQVFSSPSSQPQILVNPNQYFYYFVGYGSGSVLWVSGRDASGVYMLSRCGTTTCSAIDLTGGTLYFPGAVQWDNNQRTWVVFDQLCNNAPAACSYPVSPRGVLGTATTYKNFLGGNDCDLIQGVIFERHVLGDDYESCGSAPSTFDRWMYTAGGDPTNHSTLSDPSSIPNGVAISIK